MTDKKFKLPDKIIPIKNKDKLWHESWHKNRNLLDIPHPYRGVILGPPGVGKSTTVKNLLVRAKPEFEEIYLIHCDVENTKEYDDLDVEKLQEIPEPSEWSGERKTLVILDDLEFKLMPKDQKRCLDRLYGYCSTHLNISVVLCAQDSFNVPPSVRRCASLWILWKISDIDSLMTIARKCGMKTSHFKMIFDRLMKDHHDSLWIDLSKGSPMKHRKNGYEAINLLDL